MLSSAVAWDDAAQVALSQGFHRGCAATAFARPWEIDKRNRSWRNLLLKRALICIKLKILSFHNYEAIAIKILMLEKAIAKNELKL